MEKTMIKVLWVDDDPDILDAFPNEAGLYEIQLEPYEYWEKAERALRANFGDYDAIILDAKCKCKKDDDPNAPRFLSNAIRSVESICAERHHQIPWYVLSMGGTEVGDISDLIPESRKSWDNDWENLNDGHRPYYLKNMTERDILFSRIKEQYKLSDRTQIKTILYPDVFRAIGVCKLDSDVSILLVDLLMPIHFPCSEGVNEKHLTYAIRKILEDIFRAMIVEWHLLPPELIPNNKVNLSYTSKILSGKNVENDYGDIMIRAKGSVTDYITGLNIKNMIDIVGNYVHPDHKKEELPFTKNLSKHFEKVANTTYLIRSYALQICDFLMQLEGIVQNNPNKDENAKKWKVS